MDNDMARQIMMKRQGLLKAEAGKEALDGVYET